MSSPVVSVVIPTYERAALVERAVKSVLAQSEDRLDLVVVDDGSTDRTCERLQEIGDRRLRLLPIPHRGRSAARNEGVAHSRASVVTFLDSDDEALPDWLADLVRPFADERIGLSFCGVRIELCRPELGIRTTKTLMPRVMGPVYDNAVGLFLPGTFAVRRDLLLRAGGFEEALAYSEFTELAHRLLPAASHAGLRSASVARELVVSYRNRGPGHVRAWQERLDAVELVVGRHGHRYGRVPRSLANYCNIASVHAMRLHRYGDARSWALRSVRAWPWSARSWLRLALSFAPRLNRVVIDRRLRSQGALGERGE